MNVQSVDTETFLNIAKDATTLAGEFLANFDRKSITVNSDAGKDIKIDVDVRSEEIIIDHLTEHSPYSILSEEKGLIERDDSKYLWIVDPLDGTMNYFRNVPVCCTSIGLWRADTPLIGVIYDFNSGDYYTGIHEQGAWLNGQEISVSDIDSKGNAILSTGFPSHTDFSTNAIESFIDDFKSYKKIRMIGSAALSICYVACGKADAYFERDIMLWDIAGGIPVLTGAGGAIDRKKQSLEYAYNIFASNGKFKQ